MHNYGEFPHLCSVSLFMRQLFCQFYTDMNSEKTLEIKLPRKQLMNKKFRPCEKKIIYTLKLLVLARCAVLVALT